MLTSYAQNFEDVYIHRAFRNLDDGFYIDIGALDPTIDSVTRFFYDRGWSGINVEPGPSIAAFAAARPRDVNLRLLVADRTGEADFFYYADAAGLSGIAPIADSRGIPLGKRSKSRLPCLSLDDLVTRHVQGRHVHFLKIDVEGAEAAIINATDWQRFRPELLVVEATFPMTTQRCDDAWSQTLVRNGYYEVFFDGINLYFLREESLDRKGAFAFPVNALDGFQKYLSPDEIRERASSYRAGRHASAGSDIAPSFSVEAAAAHPRESTTGPGMAPAFRLRLRRRVARLLLWSTRRLIAPAALGLARRYPNLARAALQELRNRLDFSMSLPVDVLAPSAMTRPRFNEAEIRAVEDALVTLALRKDAS